MKQLKTPFSSSEVTVRQYDGKAVLWSLEPNPTIDREELDHYWKTTKNRNSLLLWVPIGVYDTKKEAYQKGLTFRDKEAKV